MHFKVGRRDGSGISGASELEFLKLPRLSIALQMAQLLCKNHQIYLWKDFAVTNPLMTNANTF